MGYVAVRGGGLAIEESLKLLERERVEGSDGVSADAVEDAFPGLVEQVMGEGLSLRASPCCSGIEAGTGLARRGGVSAARVSLDA